MLRASWVVLRKELWERFGSGSALRASLIQAGVIVLTLGVLTPAAQAEVLIAVAPTAIPYFVFPQLLAATLAADAFSGERERKTLETLLATPLPDAALVLGKTLPALLFAAAVSAVSLLTAWVTVALVRGPLWPDPALLAGTLVAGIGTGAIMAALAVTFAMYVPVARAGQQMMSMIAVLGGMITYAELHKLKALANLDELWRLDLIALLLGLLLLTGAAVRFDRRRFFERR